MKYKEKQFVINHLDGISEKQIEEHLKLYSGYVKHSNLIDEKISQLLEDNPKLPETIRSEGDNSYVISELRRRFGFEFNGMRMHEYYFEQFEGRFKEKKEKGHFVKFIIEQFSDFDLVLKRFKDLASTTRGIGWAVLSYDKSINKIQMNWVGSHEIGQLAGVDILLVIDMWEHAFMVDYTSGEKKKYIKAFFDNLNWKVVEKRFHGIININLLLI